MNQAAEVMNEVEVKASRKSTFMQRVWAKMGKEEKGFTLIELLAVLVIIAIIAVIAIPLIGNIINNSRQDSDLATARQVYDASRLYITSQENGDFQGTATTTGGTTTNNRTVTIENLQTNGFIDNPLYLPSSKLAIQNTGTVNYVNGALSADRAVVISDGTTTRTYTSEQILSSERE